jgi:hypothetical protein
VILEILTLEKGSVRFSQDFTLTARFSKSLISMLLSENTGVPSLG